MKEKLLSATTVIFLGFFFGVIFSNARANTQIHHPRVKSHIQFNKNFSGKAHVLDGDSIKVGENEVRLVGIDAPEFKQNCFDSQNEQYACGQASFEFLRNLAEGKNVECVYGQKDKYNRFLSKCSVKKTSINEEIIKNGMAVIYNFNESDKKMNELEIQAKTAKLGIWRGAFELPKDYRKKHPR